jgi:hypothetical protein
MTCFQVSDTSFHSLEGLRDGLVSMLGDVAFDGNFDAAHTLADTGGDIIGATLWNMSYANQW